VGGDSNCEREGRGRGLRREEARACRPAGRTAVLRDIAGGSGGGGAGPLAFEVPLVRRGVLGGESGPLVCTTYLMGEEGAEGEGIGGEAWRGRGAFRGVGGLLVDEMFDGARGRDFVIRGCGGKRGAGKWSRKGTSLRFAQN